MRRASNVRALVWLIIWATAPISALIADELIKFESGRFALRYSKDYYSEVTLEPLPKKVAQANEFPAGVGPARWALDLSHPSRSSWRPKRPRFFYPAHSIIFATPLRDKSVKDFAKAYPGLTANRKALLEVLPLNANQFHSRIENWNEWSSYVRMPDEPFNNAGEALLSKYRHLKTPWGSGIRLLTYYRQGSAGYGATNVELVYNFQGITTDREYYISARLSLRHPSLPDSIDDPRAKSEETVEEDEAEQRRVNSWEDRSFFPPLPALDSMIASLKIKD